MPKRGLAESIMIGSYGGIPVLKQCERKDISLSIVIGMDRHLQYDI